MESILASLNEKQKEAVETTEGYVCVLAGAGSGKTKALTHRYAYLVEELGISTSNILCVTFTNKAASEMRSRIRNLIGDHDTGYVCTFHGFCVKLLREEIHLLNYPANFAIIDEDDQNTILESVYSERNVDARKYTLSMARDMIEARKGKEDYIPLMSAADNRELKRLYNSATDDKDIIFYGYMLEQKKNVSLDYEDLIHFAFHILVNYEDRRLYWQKRMEYVMVDEFQDVSQRQYALADILSGYHKNLFVVGDPDQTIYSWRGADVKFFLKFPETHENTTLVVMDQNYRSNSPIILASNSLIENNKKRFEKQLFATKQGGNKIQFYHGKDVNDEAKWVCDKIKEMNDKGISFEQIAILYRAHHVSRPIEECFIKNKVPYVIYSGVDFYGRKEIKDIICYLRMISNGDDLAFLRTVNEPKRNVGKKRITFLQEYAKKNECTLIEALERNLSEEIIASSKASEYYRMIKKYQSVYKDIKITNLLESILEETGYERILKDNGEDERLANLAELKQSIYDYETNANEETSLDEYLQSIALFTNMDKEQKKHSVKLMTVHASKGLEFPYVFVVGMSEGVFPSSRIVEYDDLEEERRLAYVAYTRAEEELFLSDAEGITFTGETRCPSRFVFNINDELIEYLNPIEENQKALFMKRIQNSESILEEKDCPTIQNGTRIRHKIFGEGTVIEVNNEQNCYEIKFDKMDSTRSIMMSMKLEIL